MVAVKKDRISGDAIGTGRRKSSVARVRVREGSGKILINNRTLDDYFPCAKDQKVVMETLDAVEQRDKVDLKITVSGGGSTGQSGACRMGIARALIGLNGEFFSPLRDGGFLTRDARMKERKKYGLHGARRGTQFSKR